MTVSTQDEMLLYMCSVLITGNRRLKYFDDHELVNGIVGVTEIAEIPLRASRRDFM